MALLFMPVSAHRYVRRIKKSGQFDRQFYVAANPGMHWSFRYMPERHFVLYGEDAGLCPNPKFSPPAYLRNNPDVAHAGLRPFDHYILIGHREERVTDNTHVARIIDDVPVPVLARRPRRADRPRFAVLVHIYYHDLWGEFYARLQTLTFDYDLFVTITWLGDETDELAQRIAYDCPEAEVIVMPNRGRDVLPFVHVINAGWLEGYEAVCKFHTKRSPHRHDGDHWRQHLIDGILPPDGNTEALDRFLADPEAAIWVADGQHFTEDKWWGSNYERTTHLLHRIDQHVDRSALSFPAGSIYWLKPQIAAMIRGLQLTAYDFEPEIGQTDGTLAHAVERVIGIMIDQAGLRIMQTTQLMQESRKTLPLPRPGLVSAFYLPQFHQIPENDLWWGPGYTEWTAASRARAQFEGHGQPNLPTELGFYDLRVTDVMARQAALAREAGIDAFCVYHYWFDGRRVLEAPIDSLMARPEIAFPFYLCWANESWRRNWDGLSGDVLIAQSYAPGFAAALARDVARYFRDPRYMRPDGVRPRFIIYRPEDMPDPAAAVAEMRAAWAEEGIGEVELGAVLFHIRGASPVDPALFDFWVEMPPHGLVDDEWEAYLFGGAKGNRLGAKVSPNFRGLIYDYDKVRQRSLAHDHYGKLPAHTIAGIMPAWDNTARRAEHAHIAWGANPLQFERWLRGLLGRRIKTSYRREIMINAWNEWAEKAMMEPGHQYHRAYLEALRRTVRQ